MADILDHAQRLEEKQRELSLQAAQLQKKPSLKNCIDCGIDIPEQRRALGGITRCIDCQQDHDKLEKNYAR